MARGSSSNTNIRHQRTRRRYPSSYRINIPFFPNNNFFTINIPNQMNITTILQTMADLFLYMLGPLLILLVFCLLGSLSYTFFTIIIPLMTASASNIGTTSSSSTASSNIHTASISGYDGGGHFTLYALTHEIFVIFILCNITYNYIYCVCTKNGNQGDEKYERVVRELAQVTNFRYPETREEIDEWRAKYRQMMLERSRAVRVQREQHMQQQQQQQHMQQQGQSGGSTRRRTAVATAATAFHSGDDSTTANNMKGRYDIEASTGSSENNTSSTTAQNTNNASPVITPTPTAASTTTTTPNSNANSTRPWMILGPYDWGFCEKSYLPKPPRSHYDFVTKSLVLNMDHYCPWMFNVVGYFNYRYFCNFLIYVSCGMMYGAIITCKFFMAIDSSEFHKQIILSRDMIMNNSTLETAMAQLNNSTLGEKMMQYRHSHHNHHHKGLSPHFKYTQVQHLLPNIPTPNERIPICFAFMMCLAVGIAVLCLLGFHLYLVCTSQTTIEFHGNMYKRRMAQDNGNEWINPYHLGWKRNIEQVWGKIEVEKTFKIFGVNICCCCGDDATSRYRIGGALTSLIYRLRQIGSFALLLLPSSREPEYLPLPLKSDIGRRRLTNNGYSKVNTSTTTTIYGDNFV